MRRRVSRAGARAVRRVVGHGRRPWLLIAVVVAGVAGASISLLPPSFHSNPIAFALATYPAGRRLPEWGGLAIRRRLGPGRSRMPLPFAATGAAHRLSSLAGRALAGDRRLNRAALAANSPGPPPLVDQSAAPFGARGRAELSQPSRPSRSQQEIGTRRP